MTGWLTGWGNRKSHVISAQTGAGSDYQACIKVYKTTGVDGTESWNGLTIGKVYVGSKCRDDFGDIRFTGSNGTTELDYWMEELSSGVYAIFWIEVKDSLETDPVTIYVYYSKSGATYLDDYTNLQHGENTFLFYDDFSQVDVDWTNKWVSTDHTLYSIENGKLKALTTVDLTKCLNTQTKFSGGFCVEILMRDAVSPLGQFYLNFEGTLAKVTWKDYVYLDWHNSRLAVDIAGSQSVIAYTPDTSSYFKAKYECPATGNARATWYLTGVQKLTKTAAPTLRSAYLYILSYDVLNICYADDVFVRKYISPEPLHSDWGIEEAQVNSAGSIVQLALEMGII